MRVLGIAFLATGGDFHPLVAAAAGLRARGHHVQLFCDPEGARLVEATGIGTVVDEEGWAAATRAADEVRSPIQHGAPEERARLVAEWLARRTNMLLPAFLRAVKHTRPDVLVSATLAAPLARDAVGDTGIAWCVVHSTYDFARAPETPAAEWLAPALRAAPLVLHATDAVFDDGEPAPGREYVGPLFWEPSAPVPSYLLEEGPPWALVSVSLVPQGDIALVPAALKAISACGLRGVATIGEKNDPAAVGPLPPGRIWRTRSRTRPSLSAPPFLSATRGTGP